MDSSLQGITPLRQRMIDDMRMRKFAATTDSGRLCLKHQNVPSRPLPHSRIRTRIIAIPPPRDVIRRSIGQLVPSRPTATRQIPIAA